MRSEIPFELAADWDAATLGDVCDPDAGLQTGPFGSQLHADDYVALGIPSIMPQDLVDGRVDERQVARINEEDARRLSRYRVQAGDIVYSRRGDISRRAQITKREEGWLCGTGCLRVRVGDDLDSEYLFRYLGHPAVHNWLERHAVGATMPNLNTKILAALPVAVPPRDEQRRIAQILGSLDDKIESNRRIAKTLEEIAATQFKARFVDFVDHDNLVESEIGPIPRGWGIGRLADVVSRRVERCKPSPQIERLPYVPIDVIQSRTLSLAHAKPGDEAKSSLTRFYEGDILFGAMRPYFHKVCIAPFEGTTRTTVFVLTADPDDFAFAVLSLHRPETVEFATRHSRGSTIPYAKWEDSLAEMPLPMPPSEERCRFNEDCKPILDWIAGMMFEQQTLTALRDALLPRLISGQIRVPVTNSAEARHDTSSTR